METNQIMEALNLEELEVHFIHSCLNGLWNAFGRGVNDRDIETLNEMMKLFIEKNPSRANEALDIFSSYSRAKSAMSDNIQLENIVNQFEECINAF